MTDKKENGTTMIVNTDNRDQNVDIIKGIAIFLMLWGHCIQYCIPEQRDFFCDSVFKTIYSFHMPLLMLMSGYLFGLTSVKYKKTELLGRKTTPLLKAIIGGTIFEYLFSVAIIVLLSGSNLLLCLINGQWLSKLTSLWFLWSALSATIVLCIAIRYEGLAKAGIILLGFLIVALFPNYEMNIFMYPYFVVGYYCQLNSFKINNTLVRYSTIVLFLTMLLFFEKKHFIYTSGLFSQGIPILESLIIDVYRWIIGFAGSAAVIVLVQTFEKCSMQNRIKKWFALLGRNSLQVYVLSIVFLSRYLPLVIKQICRVTVLEKIYTSISENTIIYDFVLTLSLAIIYSYSLLFMARIMEKTRISKLFFGR